MTAHLTPRALGEAERARDWWRAFRPAAPDLFEIELAEVLRRISAFPGAGSPYSRDESGLVIRRVLLPGTLNHVYYAVENGEVVVLSIWGALLESGPGL
ncbi:MAG: type II toxin-antitoxin system RelE/ParE family toxin [Anaeromyxobacter sp.]